jgi:uncharacterized integral membrane protein
MIRRLVSLFILAPAAIILVALGVANRSPVQFTLDPFNPGNPLLSWQVPLFALIFAALIAGLLAGGLVTWLAQGRYRRLARDRKAEADRLLAEAAKRASAPVSQQNALSPV